MLTFLFPSVFAAVWYFPRLFIFSDNLQPLIFALYPSKFKQAKLPLLLFFNIVTALELVQKRSAVQTAEGQQRLFIHIPFIRSYKGTDMGWGEREDRCVQAEILHTRDGHFFQIYSLHVAYWPACKPTLGIPSSCAGLPVPKGGAGIQLQLKKALLAASDGHRKWEAHISLFALAWRSCTASPKMNSSWSHPCCNAGGIQHLQRWHGVCLIS